MSKNKLFTYDYEAKIVLGGKDGVAVFKLTSDNTWTIVGNLNVTGTITATVDVVGGGKSLKTHTHPYTDDGSAMTTGAPN